MSDLKADGIQITGAESHWRSLEELSTSPEDQAALKATILQKFPMHFLSRREFMEWTGGVMAVLGLSNCTRQPQERIYPYTRQPENLIPGKPLFFATAINHGGAAQGVLIESQMGRPVKVEGNPEHPSSLGATSVFAQASVLDLYDPDRLVAPIYHHAPLAFTDFFSALNTALQEQLGKGGAGLRIVTEAVLSPTLGAQLRAVLKRFPKAKWVTHDSVSRGNAREGALLAFGEPVHLHYRLEQAATIVSFDSDFLYSGPGAIRYAKDFAARRKVDVAAKKGSTRLYQFECTPSVTGASADHVWPVRPQNLFALAQAVARELGVEVAPSEGISEDLAALARGVAKDLQAHAGTSLVVTGDWQPPEMHALCHAMNAKLGNLGRTAIATPWLEENPYPTGGLAELTNEMEAGQVDLLAILGGNPVYTQPAGVAFDKAIGKVKFSFHHSTHSNETSPFCVWQLPDTHYLEMWSDTKAHDGTLTVVQPLIAPLYSGRSVHEIASALAGNPNGTGFAEVQGYWKGVLKGASFDKAWRRAVHDGLVAGTAPAEKKVALKAGVTRTLAVKPAAGIVALVRPDPSIWDGRFANNGWLQEMPKPQTKITWDNAVYVAPSTAVKLGVRNGDVLVLKHGDRVVEGPAWLLPGQPEDTLTLTLGYGRMRGGKLVKGVGFNVSPMRGTPVAWQLDDVKVGKAGRTHELVTTQRHFEMEGRDLVRSASIAQYAAHPEMLGSSGHHGGGHGAAEGAHGGGHGAEGKPVLPGTEPTPELATPEKKHEQLRVFNDADYAWGMSIDLATCNGCNACLAACQSENNVAVVGKDQVKRERILHWLRIDRYYSGDPANPDTHFQPVPCMHCETAPCTVVCPVGATTIAPDGINEMSYNRCVGTKYCSNNCPYKVRRFNFYQYSDVDTPQLQLRHNPDVTVRARGVMEKCTYCVQRVSQARIEAKKEDRVIRDGEVTPACAGACPSNAITFGNLKDPNSRVSKLKAEPRNYGLLEELGTKPRTTYLAKLRNPNPELVGLARKSF